jgi:hypothetical protein
MRKERECLQVKKDKELCYIYLFILFFLVVGIELWTYAC